MYDLISIGALSIDLFFQGKSLTFNADRFQLAVGGKYTADTLYESVGGGGANVAIGASKNGLKAAVMGKIGLNPFKKAILEDLHTADVSPSLCQYEEDYINISTILLSDKGERTIISYRPQHEHIIRSKEDLDDLLKAKAVYMGNLPDVSLSQREDILKFLRKNLILTIVNLGVRDCRRPLDQLDGFIKGIDVLIMNGHEFAEMIKKKYDDIDFSTNFVRKYSFLQDTILIITDGKKGSYGYSSLEHHHVKAAEPEKIRDTTGCGDGYTAGFIAHFVQNKDLKSAMEHGSKYAAKILAKIGAN